MGKILYMLLKFLDFNIILQIQIYFLKNIERFNNKAFKQIIKIDK